jgi:hypothetical protein
MHSSWNTDQGVIKSSKWKLDQELSVELGLVDPKEGELHMSWVKERETFLEALIDTDVQIVLKRYA